jgi:hypothetical protein
MRWNSTVEHRGFDTPLPQIPQVPITGCRSSGVYQSLALAFVVPRVRIDRRVMVLPVTHACPVLRKDRLHELPPSSSLACVHQTKYMLHASDIRCLFSGTVCRLLPDLG